jgi:hypothetical protein
MRDISETLIGEVNFPEQAKEIQQLMRASGATKQMLAEMTFIKPDTMRKYLNGYQEPSPQVMQAIRLAAQLVMSRRDRDLARADALTKDEDLRPIVNRLLVMRDRAPADFEVVQHVLDRFQTEEHERPSGYRKSAGKKRTG